MKNKATGMFWNEKANLAYRMFLAVQRAESRESLKNYMVERGILKTNAAGL
jgi:hypothetical protein